VPTGIWVWQTQSGSNGFSVYIPYITIVNQGGDTYIYDDSYGDWFDIDA